jgi:hypothetical protein
MTPQRPPVENGECREPARAEIRVRVADGVGRPSVRAVSALLRDLPGIEIVEADPSTGVLIVSGHITAEQIRRALTEAGYHLA